MNADTQQALAAIIGGAAAQDNLDATPTIISADGAIPITRSQTYILTKAGVTALTIAAPAAPGITIRVISDSANAHQITFTGNTLRGGTAAVATFTCAAQKGSGCTLVSLFPTEAAWGLASNVAGTLA